VIPRVLPLRPKAEPSLFSLPLTSANLLAANQVPLGGSRVEEPQQVCGGEDGGSIHLSTNEFQDLLKLGGAKTSPSPLDPDSNFSLSSFMEISIPESDRNAATACLSSDKFLNDTADHNLSNSSLGLSRRPHFAFMYIKPLWSGNRLECFCYFLQSYLQKERMNGGMRRAGSGRRPSAHSQHSPSRTDPGSVQT
jgi:hypothetical protein